MPTHLGGEVCGRGWRWMVSKATVPGSRRVFFTERSLAAYLAVSERLIRKWVKDGRLRSYKLGGCRRFDPADVDAFLEEHRDKRRAA